VSYPLNNTFDSAPPDGYLTALGGMSASYNSDQQAIDISAPFAQSILRFNEAANGDFWFEADVEFLSDSSGYKHLGLWMTTGNGSEGYRFSHFKNLWFVHAWNSSFGAYAQIGGDINDGAKPIAGVDDFAPTFNVGERRILRCEVICGAYDSNGVPWARLIQFKADGVLMLQVIDTTYLGKLIPGVFLSSGTARIHAIAGDTPSGLPAFPASVGAYGGSELSRLNSPSSDLWNRPGGYDCQFRPIQASRKDAYFGGNGFIAGTTKEKGTPDHPKVARVQLISENANALVAETLSDASGNYRFENLDRNQRYTVIGYDREHLYRAVIADNLIPELMP
jgi:hypothetical protein